MLRNATVPLSGQIISDELGVSRVAVWKQINSLKELGYKIESSSSGYTMQSETDHLYSWEFNSERDSYKTYRELETTMDPARKIAQEGTASITTIIAETQTKGKGRGERVWISESGGLYFTMILKPNLPLAYHHIYTLAATAILSRTINNLFQINLHTKWPNDVLYGGNKIAGVLTEMNVRGDSISWLNLGVGINVNNRPDLKGSISLKKILGREVNRRELLTSFEDNFRKSIAEDSPEEISRLWEKECSAIGKKIVLKTTAGKSYSGTVRSLDPSGALLIESMDKSMQKALFGDLYIKEKEIQ